jgi:hypothetical protein
MTDPAPTPKANSPAPDRTKADEPAKPKPRDANVDLIDESVAGEEDPGAAFDVDFGEPVPLPAPTPGGKSP